MRGSIKYIYLSGKLGTASAAYIQSCALQSYRLKEENKACTGNESATAVAELNCPRYKCNGPYRKIKLAISSKVKQ
jgi:hypothetical protein